MNKVRLIRLFLFISAFGFTSCQDDANDVPVPPENISFVIPPGFPQPVYNFTNNEVTNERFELGKRLFYDPLLSRDNSISCGSCHQQGGAFAHIDHKVSHGIDDLVGNRNSTTIFNMAWSNSFFWDGGVNHIELQPINPIQNPVEMDETLANVIAKLQASAAYRHRFLKAYGTDSITSQLMLRAMAQFMAVMVSADSKYDKFMRGDVGGNMSVQELRGLALFRKNCGSCHTEPLFTDNTFRNNGLDSLFSADPGRALITLNAADEGKFKVPSLRNVELSFPYMHDGRLRSLEKVLDHYASGIVYSPTLDPQLAGGIPLNSQEKADIISFLRTLTDYTFVNDPRFAEVN